MDILKNFTNPWESSGAFGSQALGTEVLEGNVLEENNMKQTLNAQNDYFDTNGKYLGSNGNNSQIRIIESYNTNQSLINQNSKRYGTFALTPEVHGLIAKYYLNQLKGRVLRTVSGGDFKLQFVPALGMTNLSTELMAIGRLDGKEPIPVQAAYQFDYGQDLGIQIAIKNDGSLVREIMDNVNFYKSIIIHESMHFAVDFYYQNGSYFNYPKSPVEYGWNHLNHYLVQTFTPEFQAIKDEKILIFHYTTVYKIWRNTAFLSKNETDIKFYYNEYVLRMVPENYRTKLNMRGKYD